MNIEKNVEKLKILEASLIVLTQKIYNFHWNMKGPRFLVSHKQTEELFETLTKFYDDVAEKIVMHGEVAVGSLVDALKLSKIVEAPSRRFCIDYLNSEIVGDLTTIIKLCDEVEGTNVIQPLLDEIYLALDKTRWMFQAQIQCKGCLSCAKTKDANCDQCAECTDCSECDSCNGCQNCDVTCKPNLEDKK